MQFFNYNTVLLIIHIPDRYGRSDEDVSEAFAPAATPYICIETYTIIRKIGCQYFPKI